MEIEDVNTPELDGLLKSLRDSEPKSGEVVRSLNINRVNHLQFTYKVLEKMTRGHDVKLECVIDKPFPGMGVISLETKESVIFPDTEWFARAVEFSNNFNVYPLTNGNVRMDFTFYGVTNQIKEG